jgi:hypothetical protein
VRFRCALQPGVYEFSELNFYPGYEEEPFKKIAQQLITESANFKKGW